jgi:protein-tyrosine phosphatase
MRLLFVCTGNVCRSQVAARLATAYAARGLGAQAADVVISSAGLEAPEGRPMDPRSAAALRRLGGDQTGARAMGFRPELAESADLVLTMTRHQRRAVLERTPRGLRRTFTLLEAADLAGRADLRGLEFRPLGERARDLAMRLDAARSLRTTTEADDILDPIGHRQAVHDQVATTIANALRPLAEVLFVNPGQTGAATNGVPLASLR